MNERHRRESGGAAVMDEPDGRLDALSEAEILPAQDGNAVLQESAKLAEITRERRRQA